MHSNDSFIGERSKLTDFYVYYTVYTVNVKALKLFCLPTIMCCIRYQCCKIPGKFHGAPTNEKGNVVSK